jgi:hypothetical protein
MPKFHLLYFKNILDIALIKFFDDYNDSFVKINGKYVLSKQMNKGKLLKIFKQYIKDILLCYIVKYDRLKPNYFFIIGSCLPKDNLLLQFKNKKYFPKKLDLLLNNDNIIKYVLKEKDIDIDIIKFNAAIIELSNSFFNDDFVIKHLGKNFRNVMFIQHKNIDCYVMFKLLKHFFGNSNCINIFKEKMMYKKLPLVAINDIISKYINKSDMNKSEQLKFIAKEIEQYIQERLKTL